MKFKIAALCITLLLAFGTLTENSFAKKSYSQVVTVNPLGLAIGMLNGSYEQQLSRTNSFSVNGYYWTITDWVGFGIGGSYRWYFDLFKTRKKPLEGFSVGPTISINSWTWDGFVSSYDDGMTVSIGGIAAYKWVWDGFALETGITLNFNVMGLDGLDISPFGLVGGIGYAW